MNDQHGPEDKGAFHFPLLFLVDNLVYSDPSKRYFYNRDNLVYSGMVISNCPGPNLAKLK